MHPPSSDSLSPSPADGPQLVEEYGVTAVPHFVILRGGKKVGDYVGSKEEGLEATIIAAAS